MTKEKSVQEPKSVRITCYLLFALGLATIVYSFTGVFSVYGNYFAAVNVLFIIAIFASLAGVLNMEKWGLWLYTSIVLVKPLVDGLFGAFSYWEFLLLVPLLIFWWHQKKFS